MEENTDPARGKTIEHAQQMIQDNITRLYRLPKRYQALSECLDDSLRHFLLQILRYIKDKRILVMNGRYCFYMDTTRMTTVIRRCGGRGTASRWTNFLCALGLINKLPQDAQDPNRLSRVNQAFLQEHPEKTVPVNMFSISRYSDDYLERVEERARVLQEAGVTRGNISANRLRAVGLMGVADEVFPLNLPQAFEKKTDELAELMALIDLLVETYGYATKERIAENLLWDSRELDQVFRTFREVIWSRYIYKPPTKEEINKYDLPDRRWIIVAGDRR